MFGFTRRQRQAMAEEAAQQGMTERIDFEQGRGCIYAKSEVVQQVRDLCPIYADGFGMAYVVRDDRRVPVEELLPKEDPRQPQLMICAHTWLEWVEIEGTGETVQVVVGEDPPINLHDYTWLRDADGRVFTDSTDNRAYLDDVIKWLDEKQTEFDAGNNPDA